MTDHERHAVTDHERHAVTDHERHPVTVLPVMDHDPGRSARP
ncbi:hypothetical protein [Streptomyces sp. NPDC058475]